MPQSCAVIEYVHIQHKPSLALAILALASKLYHDYLQIQKGKPNWALFYRGYIYQLVHNSCMYT